MFVFMLGACGLCHQPFSFHPNKVPSMLIDGKKEPICLNCFNHAQASRKEHGLEPWPAPLPGAYEGDEEENINWNGTAKEAL